MADLKEVRSSDKTAVGGRLFHCTIAKGENEYLYEVYISQLIRFARV